MNNNNLNQISIFDSVFGGEEPELKPADVQEERKARFASKPEQDVATCGVEEPVVDSDDDSDLPDFAAIEQDESGESTSTPSGKTAKNVEAKPKFEEIDLPWTVCYAGHKLPVQQKGITLEKIRQMLEKEFPELTKERTEMTYDEKKSIVVPVVKGAKKGGAVQC